jgi:hypothetical protein
MDDSIDHVSDREYWDLTTDNAHPAVTLYWTDNTDDLHSFGNTSSDEMTSTFVALNMTIAHYNIAQNKWNDMGTSIPSTIYFDDGKLQTTAVFPDYSPITFASKNPDFELPVELVSFTATYNSGDVLLKWVTASESNNDFFLIERSDDAMNFEPIGRSISLAPNGNSNWEISYRYYDRDISSGIYYYRLKQYDIDGAYDYSNVVTVVVGDNGMFTIHSNPAKDIVEIEYYCNGDDESVIKIVDNAGKLVYIDKLFCIKGQNSSVVDISQYTPGMYMVVLTSSNGTEKAKLIKY